MSWQSADDRQTRRIGFRRMELITQSADNAEDSPFYFCINDRPVFCRGANWIPADALPGRISAESTRALLQSSVDANMNMLRVWGGGRYEPDSFYDTCDELGLLVWQYFMFSCNLYPSTPDFLDEVSLEVADVVERLHHHACLALWCATTNSSAHSTGSRKASPIAIVTWSLMTGSIEPSNPR